MSHPAIRESALIYDRTLERLRRLGMQVPLMTSDELKNHEAAHDLQFYSHAMYDADMAFISDALRKAEYHEARGEPEKAQCCRDLAVKRRGMMYQPANGRQPAGR